MFPIPRGLEAALADFGAPLATLASLGALALLARRRSWGPSLAVLVGWALLPPWRALPAAAWSPHRPVEVLLAPAAATAAVLALVEWRGVARPRLVGTALALMAGWWVARHLAAPLEFWRVCILVALLPLLLRRTVADAPGAVLATGLALGGGLLVAAGGHGAGTPLVTAAWVVAAAGAGSLALGDGALPPALLAAVLGVADASGGRLLHGRIGAVDLACLGALAAPVLANAVARRLGRGGARVAVAGCGLAGAAAAVALVWLLRRAVLI